MGHFGLYLFIIIIVFYARIQLVGLDRSRGLINDQKGLCYPFDFLQRSVLYKQIAWVADGTASIRRRRDRK